MSVSLTTRRRRLLKLAAYLEDIPDGRKFDMSTFGEHDGDHNPERNNYCGTAACALGHAAMIPAFRRAGLRMKWVTVGEGFWAATIILGDLSFTDAGGAFFGLTHSESLDLFLRTGRRRPAVIKLIRKLADQSPADLEAA